MLAKWLRLAGRITNRSLYVDYTGVLPSLGLAGPQHDSRPLQDCLLNRFSQVLQWKAQQEEAAGLEAAGAARRKEKQDEEERLQKEQEMIRRAQEKEKVWETFIHFSVCSCVQLPLRSLTDLTNDILVKY